MVNWAYQPPEDQTDQILQNYERGQQVGQARDRKSAMSAYLPQALGGGPDAKEAVGKIAAVDPEFGVRLSTFYQSQEENARKKSLENWDFIGTILQRPDGSPIQSPEEIQHAKTLAIARGLPADQVNQVTPDSIPQLIQTSQTARQYARQAQQDELSRRQAESSIRANDALANQRGMLGGRGGPGGKPPSGYQYVIGEDGQAALQFVPGGPADPAIKPLTDEQAKAAGFASRLRDSDARLGSKEVSDALLSGYDNTVSDIPLGIGNAMVSNEYQIGDQARRDFLNAQLRRESGAVIGAGEFSSGTKQYFPNYGDKGAVLLNKELSRKQAIYNMLVSAGPRYAKDAEDARQSYIALRQEIAASAKAKPQASSTNHIDEADRIVGIKK